MAAQHDGVSMLQSVERSCGLLCAYCLDVLGLDVGRHAVRCSRVVQVAQEGTGRQVPCRMCCADISHAAPWLSTKICSDLCLLMHFGYNHGACALQISLTDQGTSVAVPRQAHSCPWTFHFVER
jgi:hypothetical protein